jgi:hypothetical protein
MIASIFSDSQETIMIDYFDQEHTINSMYYADELRHLGQEMAHKMRGKLIQGILLLHDTASANTSQVVMAAATDCRFEILPHPLYYPGLVPSDFHLFPILKTKLCGRCFGSNEGVMEVVNAFYEDQNRKFYFNWFNKLEH